MARRKKLENTSLEEQLEYVEQEIRTKESDLKELRHKAKELQKDHKDRLLAVNLRDILFLRFRPRLTCDSTADGFVHALTTQIHS